MTGVTSEPIIFRIEEGEMWWCKGKVTKKYEEGGEHLVECEIWIENGKGEVTTPSKATVILPSRGQFFRIMVTM